MYDRMGDYTMSLCTATIEDRVPPFHQGKWLGLGLLRIWQCCRVRPQPMRRELRLGKQGGRRRIQRLIGRSLRAGV